MRKLYKFILLIFLLPACTNLDDKLYDRIPESMYPENSDQGAIQTGVVYEPMQSFIDGGGWWFAQELTSDEMVCPTRLTDWDDGGKWRVLHTHTWTNTTEAVSSMWYQFYKGIGEANKLIESFETSASPEARVIIAKLKIMRAFYYYLLIDNYGNVPFVITYKTAPKEPTKAQKSEIFKSIVADIETSIPFLPLSNAKSAVTKGMAFTLLAKLYLNAEVYSGAPQWQKAETACDSVMKLNFYSLESNVGNPFITQNQGSLENIFTIPYDEDTYKGFNLHMRTLHYISNKTFNMSAGPWNGFAVTEAHFNSYEAADKRKEAYFLVGKQYAKSGVALFDETAGAGLSFDPKIPALKMDASFTSIEIRMSGARVKKFEIKENAKDNLSNDFPIFRYADVLLMKAEAMVRQAKNGDQYINLIRTRAGVSAFTNVTLDQILAERGRELFWEAHRRQDLIRFGKFGNAWWEKSASSADRKTFPIPQWVIDANPNLAN